MGGSLEDFRSQLCGALGNVISHLPSSEWKATLGISEAPSPAQLRVPQAAFLLEDSLEFEVPLYAEDKNS